MVEKAKGSQLPQIPGRADLNEIIRLRALIRSMEPEAGETKDQAMIRAANVTRRIHRVHPFSKASQVFLGSAERLTAEERAVLIDQLDTRCAKLKTPATNPATHTVQAARSDSDLTALADAVRERGSTSSGSEGEARLYELYDDIDRLTSGGLTDAQAIKRLLANAIKDGDKWAEKRLREWLEPEPEAAREPLTSVTPIIDPQGGSTLLYTPPSADYDSEKGDSSSAAQKDKKWVHATQPEPDDTPVTTGTSKSSRFASISSFFAGSPTRLTASVAAAAAIAGVPTTLVVTKPWEDRGERCVVDATHARLRNPGDAAEIPAIIKEERGYPTRLVDVLAANPHLTNETTHKEVTFSEGSTELPAGVYCVKLPTPFANGMRPVDGTISLATIAAQTGLDIKTLRQLNKGLVPDDDRDPIKEGTIWLTKSPNTNLILRVMKEKGLLQLIGMADPSGGDPIADPQKLMDIVLANIDSPAVNDGQGFETGQAYFLPWDKAVPTEWMVQHHLTWKQVIDAFKKAGAYDVNKRNKAAKPTPTPEQSASGVALTAEQRLAIINSLHYDNNEAINAEKKKFFTEATELVIKYKAELEAKGINAQVLLGQMYIESGGGQSDLAKQGHNYLGMKANNGWTGPTMQYKGETWRVYDGMEKNIIDYMLDTMSKSWRNDARKFGAKNPAKYLDGLQNELDENGNIRIPGKLAYCEDKPGQQPYKVTILGAIGDYKIAKLLGYASSPTPKPTPQPTIEVPSFPGDPVHLNLNDYPSWARHFWVSDKAVKIGNVLIADNKIPLEQRIRIIEANLTGAVPTIEGYDKFKAEMEYAAAHPFTQLPTELRNIEGHDLKDYYSAYDANPDGIFDLTKVVPKEFRNFNGTKYGKPDKPWDFNRIVFHFTASTEDANDHTCNIAAMSIQNGGRGIGIQWYQSNEGLMCHLTFNNTAHVYPAQGHDYNREDSIGIEDAAVSQVGINSKQYVNLVYFALYHLEKAGKIKKGEPIAPVIKEYIFGHGELNGNPDWKAGDGHTDFNPPVMDALRKKIAYLGDLLGYQVNANDAHDAPIIATYQAPVPPQAGVTVDETSGKVAITSLQAGTGIYDQVSPLQMRQRRVTAEV